jgi:aerobic carbon-monoxide dehydrogenase medium subunit
LKAPPFAYVRPLDLVEVFDLLEKHGEKAKLLAGGQSLIATLNMRLSAPELLIDISRLAGLSGIQVKDGTATIGALATHAQIERSEDIRKYLPLLAQAAPHIAHPAIRNVGTIGGSLALADPAAEWPACCVALDAQFAIAGKKGTRKVAAREFFKGLYATALQPDEVLTGIEISLPGADHRSAFVELAQRRGDYAIVGLAAVARGSQKRLAFLGAGDRPMLAVNAGKAKDLESAKAELKKDLSPAGDLYHTPATKLHLAGVLLERAWSTL